MNIGTYYKNLLFFFILPIFLTIIFYEGNIYKYTYMYLHVFIKNVLFM